jgi:hypothetical protein
MAGWQARGYNSGELTGWLGCEMLGKIIVDDLFIIQPN